VWFGRRGEVDWEQAEAHLAMVDAVMGGLIGRVGPCGLRPRRDYFVALCQAIFTQQVSTAVAAVLFGRFRTLFPNGRPTPERVLALSDEQLVSAGLSRQKRTYILDLAGHFAAGTIPTRRFCRMNDEQIIQSLLPVKGIGRWTAEMFLIFVLNRPDLLPVDDFGVRKSIQRFYGLAAPPDSERMLEIAEPWRPWRTIGTWYLWRAGATG
jgi:DNA-3-methyladenine glycosylase II